MWYGVRAHGSHAGFKNVKDFISCVGWCKPCKIVMLLYLTGTCFCFQALHVRCVCCHALSATATSPWINRPPLQGRNPGKDLASCYCTCQCHAHCVSDMPRSEVMSLSAGFMLHSGSPTDVSLPVGFRYLLCQREIVRSVRLGVLHFKYPHYPHSPSPSIPSP